MNHLFGCESRLERNESHQGCACQCHRPTFAEKYHMVDQSIGQPIGKVERCTALEMPEYPRSRTNRQCRLAAHHQGLHEAYHGGVNKGHYPQWGSPITIADMVRERDKQVVERKPE